MPTTHPILSDRRDAMHHEGLYGHPAIMQVFFAVQHVHGTLPECIHCVSDSPVLESSQEARFYELVARWREETGGLSSPRSITNHWAYQQIIEMGRPVLPLVFKDLRENGGWWYPALRALTGTNPVPDSARGSPPLNDKAWLEWGEENGYA